MIWKMILLEIISSIFLRLIYQEILQHCKIYITSTAQEKVRKEIVANLNTAKSSIRHSLGKRIEIRRVPEINFKDDVVLDKGLSVLKILLTKY